MISFLWTVFFTAFSFIVGFGWTLGARTADQALDSGFGFPALAARVRQWRVQSAFNKAMRRSNR